MTNAAGAPVKALPAARGEAEAPTIAAAKKQLGTVKKELKLVLPAQTARLKEAMCTERCWSVEDWRRYLLAHPIVGRLARRLVWIARDGEGAALATFRPTDDGGFTGNDDGAVALDTAAHIQSAHASLVSAADRMAWQAHLSDYEVAPPFEQFGRELLALPEASRANTAIVDRKGWMIETFKLRGAATRSATSGARRRTAACSCATSGGTMASA